MPFQEAERFIQKRVSAQKYLKKIPKYLTGFSLSAFLTLYTSLHSFFWFLAYFCPAFLPLFLLPRIPFFLSSIPLSSSRFFGSFYFGSSVKYSQYKLFKRIPLWENIHANEASFEAKFLNERTNNLAYAIVSHKNLDRIEVWNITNGIERTMSFINITGKRHKSKAIIPR